MAPLSDIMRLRIENIAKGIVIEYSKKIVFNFCSPTFALLRMI